MVKSVAARQPAAVGRSSLLCPLPSRLSARTPREEISLIRDIIYDDFLTLALLWWLPLPVSRLSTRAVLPRAPRPRPPQMMEKPRSAVTIRATATVHPFALAAGAQLEVFLPFHNCS